MSLEDAFAAAIGRLTAPDGALSVGEEASLRVFTKGPQTLRELYEDARSNNAQRQLLLQQDEAGLALHCSYQDFFREADALALGLARLGLRRGQRLALAMSNRKEWLASFVAATAMGSVAVALNSFGSGDELVDMIVRSDPSVLVLDEPRANRLGDARLRSLSTSGIRIISVGFAKSGGKDMLSYTDLLGANPAARPVAPSLEVPEPGDDACIFFTSGTEGRPKGVVSTHRAVMQSLLSFHLPGRAGASLRPPGAPAAPPATRLLATPLFHISGCHTNFLMALFDGGLVVLMTRWDAAAALELIERERVALFSGPPVMVTDLLEHPSFESRDLSSLVSVGFGGSATPSALIRRVTEAIPSALPGTGWGGTETNGQGSSIFGPLWLAEPSSVGRAGVLVDLKTVDPASGDDLPPGSEGELCIRSPSNFRGYWRDEEATARATLPGGWYRSGDVGIVGGDGLVRIKGRAKEVIIRGGENISPLEVEDVLSAHPSVLECCIFDLPDPKFGEVPAAAVVLRPGHEPASQDIRLFLSERLAKFKVPAAEAIHIVKEPLPRGPTGKVLKRVIRTQVLPLSKF